jgi:hypothetical protein
MANQQHLTVQRTTDKTKEMSPYIGEKKRIDIKKKTVF